MVLRTYIGTVLAIAALDLLIFSVVRIGIAVPEELIVPRLEGFARNPNAFALQLVLAIAATLVFVEGARAQTLCLALALTGLWFSGSRAAFIALGILLTIGLAMRTVSLPRLLAAAALALAAIGFVDWLPEMVLTVYGLFQVVVGAVVGLFSPGGTGLRDLVLTPPVFSALEIIAGGYGSSNVQRIASLEGGFAMFSAHPLFGAGLGAFIEGYMRAHGTPLVIHSTPLWLLAEMGIVGLLVFFAPLLRIMKHEAYSADRADPARTFLLLALPAFAAVAAVHDILYQRPFWLLIGSALAYRHAAVGEPAAQRCAAIAA